MVKRTVKIDVRLEPEEKAAWAARAAELELSPSALVRRVMSEWLAADGSPGSAPSDTPGTPGTPDVAAVPKVAAAPEPSEPSEPPEPSELWESPESQLDGDEETGESGTSGESDTKYPAFVIEAARRFNRTPEEILAWREQAKASTSRPEPEPAAPVSSLPHPDDPRDEQMERARVAQADFYATYGS